MFNRFVFLIPTIGRKTLANTIVSIYEQSNSNWFSLIIWDNNEPFISDADGKIENIKTEKKLGIGKNGAGNVRNFGIQYLVNQIKENEIKSQDLNDTWIVFVDDDDTINPFCLDFLNRYMNSIKDNFDIYCMSMTDKGKIYPPPNIEIKNLKGYIGIPMAIRLSKLFDNKIRFTPGQYEDWEFLMNAENNGLKIKILNEVLYNVKPIDTI